MSTETSIDTPIDTPIHTPIDTFKTMDTDTMHTMDTMDTTNPREQEFEENWGKFTGGADLAMYTNIWMDLPGSRFVSNVVPTSANKHLYKEAFLANQILYYPVYRLPGKEGAAGRLYKVKKGGTDVYIKAFFKHSSALEEEETCAKIASKITSKGLVQHMPALSRKFIYNEAILKEKDRLARNERLKINEATYTIHPNTTTPQWLVEYLKIAPHNASPKIESSLLLYSPQSVYHPGDWFFECIQSQHQAQHPSQDDARKNIANAIATALNSGHLVITEKPISSNSYDSTNIKTDNTALTRISSWCEVDWHERGVLSDVLKKGRLHQRSIPNVVTSLAHAIYALRLCNIFHCDVKPDNVVIGEYGKARLIDIGNAFTDPEEAFKCKMQFQMWGTPEYASPEVFLHAHQSEEQKVQIGQIVFAKDIWSFGIILLDIWDLRGVVNEHEQTRTFMCKSHWKKYANKKAENTNEDTPANVMETLRTLGILGSRVVVKVEEKEIENKGIYVSRSAAKLILACLQFDADQREKDFLRLMGSSFRKTLKSRRNPFTAITNAISNITKRPSGEFDDLGELGELGEPLKRHRPEDNKEN